MLLSIAPGMPYSMDCNSIVELGGLSLRVWHAAPHTRTMYGRIMCFGRHTMSALGKDKGIGLK